MVLFSAALEKRNLIKSARVNIDDITNISLFYFKYWACSGKNINIHIVKWTVNLRCYTIEFQSNKEYNEREKSFLNTINFHQWPFKGIKGTAYQ